MRDDNGTNPGNGRMIALLERIALANERTNERLDQTNQRLDQTNERLGQTNQRVEAGFARLDKRMDETNQKLDILNAKVDVTNDRLDNMVAFLGSHHRNHEDRIRALEDQVFPKRKG